MNYGNRFRRISTLCLLATFFFAMSSVGQEVPDYRVVALGEAFGTDGGIPSFQTWFPFYSINDEGEVVFVADTSTSTQSDEEYWMEEFDPESKDYELVYIYANSGQEMVGGVPVSNAGKPIHNNDGNVVFNVSFGAGQSGYVIRNAAELSLQIRSDQTAPGTARNFSGASNTAFRVNDTQAVFDDRGIWSYDFASTQVTAATDEIDPFGGGLVALNGDNNLIYLEDFDLTRDGEVLTEGTALTCTCFLVGSHATSNDDGDVAFWGTREVWENGSRLSQDEGLFAHISGQVEEIILEGQPASIIGSDTLFLAGLFANRRPLYLADNGSIIFSGGIEGEPVGSDQGVWAWRDGQVSLLIREGSTMPVEGFEQDDVRAIDFTVDDEGLVGAVLRYGALNVPGIFVEERNEVSGQLEFRKVLAHRDSVTVAPGDVRTIENIVLANATSYQGLESGGDDGRPQLKSPGGLVVTANVRKTVIPFTTSNILLVAAPGTPQADPVIRLVDANDFPIENKAIDVYEVEDIGPDYSETHVATLQTDAAGYLDIAGTNIQIGDYLKFTRQLYVRKSEKRTPDIQRPANAFSLHVDNLRYNEPTFRPEYHTVAGDTQEVALDHSTIAVNLVVDIEWDAEDTYRDSLRASLQKTANYMYDVFDGQVVLDTVRIQDKGSAKSASDIRIVANPMQWASAHAGGLTGFRENRAVWLPPKWWGNSDKGRDSTWKQVNLELSTSTHYRTVAHELGHYAFALYDEYLFWHPDSMVYVSNQRRCAEVPNYGMMDRQYENSSPDPTELSSSVHYATAECRNTKQFRVNGKSSWDFVEDYFEGVYDDITFNILKPDERSVQGPYFNGPNDDVYVEGLDLDVGSRIVFMGANTAPAFPGGTKVVFINDALTGDPLGTGGLSIVQIYDSGRRVALGESAREGFFRAWGADENYELQVNGNPAGPQFGDPEGANYKTANGQHYSWFSGVFDADADIELEPIDGAFPLVPAIVDDGATLRLDVQAVNLFPQAPSITVLRDGQQIESGPFSNTDDVYSIDLASPTTDQVLNISATDSTSSPFFFEYIVDVDSLVELSLERRIVANDGFLELEIDSVNFQNGKLVVASTSYPPRRDGLDDSWLQAGHVYAVARTGAESLQGANTISIRYRATDIDTTANSPVAYSLHVFGWDSDLATWEMLPSSVDTANSVVTARMTEAQNVRCFHD